MTSASGTCHSPRPRPRLTGAGGGRSWETGAAAPFLGAALKLLTTTTPLSVPANALLGVLAARSMSAHALQL